MWKTKYALFGNAKDSPSITQNTLVKREDKPFRLLGIILTGDLNNLEINWEKTSDSARKEAFQWLQLNPSITAKVNIIKSCVMSKFTHVATIIPNPPKEFITRFEQMIIKFINGESNRYSKQIIFTPKKYGGLGIHQIQHFWHALKLTWIRRSVTSNELWFKLLTEKQQNNIPVPCENTNTSTRLLMWAMLSGLKH